MIVVADTSPLNYLILSGYVWILPELLGKVLFPQAVLSEMLHPQAPAASAHSQLRSHLGLSRGK